VGSEEVPDTGPVAAIYHRALPHVYGYLLSRCGDVSLAEDLAAETFMAAVDGAAKPDPPLITVPWLIGVARHKLADHWRRSAREESTRAAATQARAGAALDDPWDEWLDTEAAYAALRSLSAPQRAALTLRYLDGLPVADVAAHLGRSLHATETLLSVPGLPGAGRPLPDGTVPAAGGSNRITLQVTDVTAAVAELRAAGVPIRADVSAGVAVRQALIEDPAGNLVELYEPAAGYHERPSTP
jgi:RNA polymerase sigma-70 factor (ECF subfamily)